MTGSKLINRAKFAEMAGVSAAAVTRACKNILEAAVVGNRINMNHPDAEAYLEKHAPKDVIASGFDPLYEEAARACLSANRFSLRFVKDTVKVGTKRGQRIVEQLKAAGIIPKPGELPKQIEPKSERVVRGHAAKNETKKTEALANINHGPTLHEIPADIEKFADMTLRELIQRYGSDVAFADWLKATKIIEEINAKRLKNAETRGELVNRERVRLGVIEPINTAHVQLMTDGAKTIARRATTLHAAGESVEDIEKYIVELIASFIRPVKAKITKALGKA